MALALGRGHKVLGRHFADLDKKERRRNNHFIRKRSKTWSNYLHWAHPAQDTVFPQTPYLVDLSIHNSHGDSRDSTLSVTQLVLYNATPKSKSGPSSPATTT